MNVGIITFHRALNYGAILQCYALQEVLKKKGYQVEVIDYRQSWIEAFYKPFSIPYFTKHLKTLRQKLHFFKNYGTRRKLLIGKRLLFNRFLQKHISLSKNKYGIVEGEKQTYVGDYDVYVIGSDQLWGLVCLGGVFDTVYLGNIRHSEGQKIIGYAISTNRNSLEQFVKEELHNVQNFDKLSLREAYAVDYLNNATSGRVVQTIDPTLLLDRDGWSPLINDKYSAKKYVAVYQVRAPQGRMVLLDKAKTLAAAEEWDVIDLSSGAYSIEDFVSIIRYAQCVVTSSFHATVFSIIFGVPFYTFVLNDGKDDRYVDLLNKLGLSDHIQNLTDTPENLILVDDVTISKRLIDYRRASLQFLDF